MTEKSSQGSSEPKRPKIPSAISLEEFRASVNSILDLAKEGVDRDRLVERVFQIVHELAKNIAVRANEKLADQFAKETVDLQGEMRTANLKSEIDARVIKLLSAHNLIMTQALKEIKDKALNPPLLGVLGCLVKIGEIAHKALILPDIDAQENKNENLPESP